MNATHENGEEMGVWSQELWCDAFKSRSAASHLDHPEFLRCFGNRIDLQFSRCRRKIPGPLSHRAAISACSLMVTIRCWLGIHDRCGSSASWKILNFLCHDWDRFKAFWNAFLEVRPFWFDMKSTTFEQRYTRPFKFLEESIIHEEIKWRRVSSFPVKFHSQRKDFKISQPIITPMTLRSSSGTPDINALSSWRNFCHLELPNFMQVTVHLMNSRSQLQIVSVISLRCCL
jgi:hypothetical protein